MERNAEFTELAYKYGYFWSGVRKLAINTVPVYASFIIINNSKTMFKIRWLVVTLLIMIFLIPIILVTLNNTFLTTPHGYFFSEAVTAILDMPEPSNE